jgi:hypothetical protein
MTDWWMIVPYGEAHLPIRMKNRASVRHMQGELMDERIEAGSQDAEFGEVDLNLEAHNRQEDHSSAMQRN